MPDAITTASLRALRPKGRTYEVTCSRLPGFIVRVLPSGKKVFFVRHRQHGRDDRVRLGIWSETFPLDEARRQAMAVLAGQPAPTRGDDDLDAWHDCADPQPDARAGRASARQHAPHDPPASRSRPRATRSPEPLQPSPSHLTVREVAARFEREYLGAYLKPATAERYSRHLREHILPALGDRPIDEVTRADARALHARLAEHPDVADYSIAVLGSLFSRIINDWELADIRNPTSGVKRFGSRRRERFLSPAERRAVLRQLAVAQRTPWNQPGHVDPASAWAIRLLMLTGQRRDEILTLQWPMVDWQHSCIHFPDTKTGQRSVAVSREALALLREIHDKTGNPSSGLVLRGRRGNKLGALNMTWIRVRRAAGVPDVRLHDLRHSFASDALMAGVPLAIVGELLGHRQTNTTKRYAHLADHVVRDALETATKRMLDAGDEADEAEQPFVPLTDAQWRRVGPLINADRRRGGVPVDLRGIVDGIRWVLQRKVRWHDLPASFGTPTTCWRWHKRWSEDGTWARVCEVAGG